MEEGSDGRFDGGEIKVYHYVLRLVAGAVSGALTGIFALVGAFTGAITGALAGRASDSGVLRGAGLGAIVGAALSVEVLESSRAYWCSDHLGSLSSSSMAGFMEELLHGRFVEGQFPPVASAAHHWPASISNLGYNEAYDTYGDIAPRGGLSEESMKKLSCHTISGEVTSAQNICCTICLQDIEVGEMARSLPRCQHTFHLNCVDKWLIRQASCPVCSIFMANSVRSMGGIPQRMTQLLSTLGLGLEVVHFLGLVMSM